MSNLYQATRAALAEVDPDHKVQAATELVADWQAGRLNLQQSSAKSIDQPGRPVRPELVHPRELKQRSLHTTAGRVVFIHAIAHIEFNAINLALDAVCRFQYLPADYYGDWLRVAAEESKHFQLLRERLRTLGHDYGDFPAHDGLWDMARRTAHDPLARMALVPRVLEARGLDVTPGMISKLEQAGDFDTVAILQIILRDEIEHVAIGSRWFHYFCQQRSLEPSTTFSELLGDYFQGPLRGPFNLEARRQAGFSAAELAQFESL